MLLPGGYYTDAYIHSNSFTDCTKGIYANTPLDATNNYWDAASGPHDPSDDREDGGDYNPSGSGLLVSDRVEYRPWLTGPTWLGVLDADQEADFAVLFSGSKPNGDGTYTAQYHTTLLGNANAMDWDFNGDGTVDQTTEAFTGNIAYTFQSPGNYTTIVMATTESGDTIQRSTRAAIREGTASLDLLIRDENGQIVQTANVAVGDYIPTWSGPSAQTYTVSDILPGDYLLTIQSEGHISHSERIALSHGKNAKEVSLTIADAGTTPNPNICKIKIGVPKGVVLDNLKWVEDPIFIAGAGLEVRNLSAGSFEVLFKPEVYWKNFTPATIRVLHPIDGELDYNWIDVETEGIHLNVASMEPGDELAFQAIAENGAASELFYADMTIAPDPIYPGVSKKAPCGQFLVPEK